MGPKQTRETRGWTPMSKSLNRRRLWKRNASSQESAERHLVLITLLADSRMSPHFVSSSPVVHYLPFWCTFSLHRSLAFFISYLLSQSILAHTRTSTNPILLSAVLSKRGGRFITGKIMEESFHPEKACCCCWMMMTAPVTWTYWRQTRFCVWQKVTWCSIVWTTSLGKNIRRDVIECRHLFCFLVYHRNIPELLIWQVHLLLMLC